MLWTQDAEIAAVKGQDMLNIETFGKRHDRRICEIKP